MNRLALKLPHQRIILNKICRFAQCARGPVRRHPAPRPHRPLGVPAGRAWASCLCRVCRVECKLFNTPLRSSATLCRVCRVETIFSRTFYFNWILIFLFGKRVIVPCTPCTHRILCVPHHQNNRRNQDFSFLHLFKGGSAP